MSTVTQILSKIEQGGPTTAAELLPLVYDELRRLAAQKMAQEKAGHTLQPTALVHEAWIRLVEDGPQQRWNSRGHFFGAAAEAMRRILVENARRKVRKKRGGDMRRIDVDRVDLVSEMLPEELLTLDDAIGRLADDDVVAAKLVELRYFGGMSIEQAAGALDTSIATAYRHWTYARAWLHNELLRPSR